MTLASTAPSALVSAPYLRAMETTEEELAIRLIPQERSVMLLQVSKTMRTAMQRVSPPAMIKVKRGQRPESVKNAMLNMMKWCRITAIDLSYTSIKVGRLAAMPGQCASLAHLDLAGNGIGAEGAGKLAAVLAQCASLAHLHLSENGIGAEGAGRLAAVAERCPSLTIYFGRS